MSDILGGETWVDGEQVTGARLNNDVNDAVIQPAFVTSKTLMSTADLSSGTTVDSLLVYDVSAAALKRTTTTNLLALSGAGTVTSVGINLPDDTFSDGGPVTGAGTLTSTFKAQNLGETHIAPVGAAGVPTWRRLEPRDMVTPTVNIAALAIDWNLGDVFYKLITGPGNVAFSMSNTANGRTIQVFVGQTPPATATVTWAGAGLGFVWEGGTPPVQTTGNTKWDWYQFTKVYSSYVFGVRLAANMQL